jgi:hypothetical protein
MKKLLLISLIVLSSLCASSYAGIVGVTRWIKNGQTVCIFFDSHDKGSAEENLKHFNYLKDNIFNHAPQRSKPLLVLVENFMRESQYREIAQRVEHHYELDKRFLQQFNPWVDKDLHGPITVKSIDARVVPTLTFPLFCEWQKRGNGLSNMPDALYTSLDEMFKNLTFGAVFAQAKQIDTYILKAPNESIKEFFVIQKKMMCELINDAIKILKVGGFTEKEIETKPIKTIWDEITQTSSITAKETAWIKLFMKYRGQDFWPIDLLWQLTNAHALWEIVNTKNDIALFTGSYHAVAIEQCLEKLGFTQTGVAKKDQVEIERHNFNTDDDYIKKDMELISLAAFKWLE